jgi:hypothetical protein
MVCAYKIMIEATTLVKYLEQIHYNLLYILYQLVSRSSGGRREHNEGKTCAPSKRPPVPNRLSGSFFSHRQGLHNLIWISDTQTEDKSLNGFLIASNCSSLLE